MRIFKRPLFELPLQVRMFIVFFAVIAVFALYTSYQFTKEINEQFQRYESVSRERSTADIVGYLEAVYQQDKSWNIRSGQASVRQSMLNGQVVTLLNDQREIIWRTTKQTGQIISPTTTQRRIPRGRRGAVEAPVFSFEVLDSEQYEIMEKPIRYNGWTVGYVVIASDLNSSLHPEGVDMQQYLLVSAMGTVFLGLVLAGITAMILSHLLSDPLRNLTHAAVEMQSGNLNHKIEDRSGTREIAQLTRALNFLAISLQEQRALRKRLTSDISHEIRTPLNALLALSEAYMDGVVEVGPESLLTFRAEILRLTSLVGELGKISDLEDDNLTLKKERIVVDDLLQDLAIVYEQLGLKSGLSFWSKIGSEQMIHADIDRFKQAVINLLSNAMKYTPSGGSVGLQTRVRDHQLIIEVVDTGYGVPDAEKELIFERFYRLEQSRNRGTGGVGLGLTLVKRIVDAHGWKIIVKNNTPQGSIFALFIPLKA
ncbi:ATP-binding protein [Entomospira culicis]|uniref:histidine kinase n=1 Tax=Entomospira culicis TaxID=2719989 RepID=A0A968GE50_9SPIO|nr:ATP-binding protein [Entomospira culicis]NIZ18653.1 HAMP domain-containing protein [Entomospira culicis]NIZ68868.1 HAMP domain-containing protein [Entomospira culicis]WDI37461.1 ATP-binding protein [Entomospira culicis]WDI39089.1 ATP-binding protein [Entomospira culicis]